MSSYKQEMGFTRHKHAEQSPGTASPFCLFSPQPGPLAAFHGHNDVASPWSNPTPMHPVSSLTTEESRFGSAHGGHGQLPQKRLEDGFTNKVCVCLPQRRVSLPCPNPSSFPPGPAPHGIALPPERPIWGDAGKRDRSHWPMTGKIIFLGCRHSGLHCLTAFGSGRVDVRRNGRRSEVVRPIAMPRWTSLSFFAPFYGPPLTSHGGEMESPRGALPMLGITLVNLAKPRLSRHKMYGVMESAPSGAASGKRWSAVLAGGDIATKTRQFAKLRCPLVSSCLRNRYKGKD